MTKGNLIAPPAVPGGLPERLPLNSLPNARRSLARLLQAFYRGQLDAETARVMIFGINTLSGILKAERDDEVISRIEVLEAATEGRQPNENR